MRKLSLLAALLLVAACGSSSLGDLGSIFGTPTNTNQQNSVQATVNFIDTTNQRIDVQVNYVNNLRNSQSGSQSIYYDNRTQVVYQGNSNYSPTDLERGDQITVTGTTSGGRFVADTITVTRNVRG